MKFKWVFVLLVSLWGILPAVEWDVDLQANNEVKFISRAETFIKTFQFEGVTHKIDGYLFWQDDSLFSGNEFYFEVDLNSFDTGIKKRNQDMRNMVLETEKWSTASYKGKIVNFQKMDTTVIAYKVLTRGKLNLHGVEKTIEIPGEVFLKGDNVWVQANFSILLTDYHMKIPSILVAKVANKIDIQVRVSLKKVSE